MSGKQLGSRFSQEPELARRIEHLLESYTDFDSFAQSVKTKNRTLTSVSRYLTQIMLGIDTEILNALRECAYAPYARVLGFRRNAAPLLDEIKKQARIPLITSLKDTPLLSEKKQAGSCLLMTDLRASEIYQIPFTGIDRTFQNDFRHPLIFL